MSESAMTEAGACRWLGRHVRANCRGARSAYEGRLVHVSSRMAFIIEDDERPPARRVQLVPLREIVAIEPIRPPLPAR